MRELQVNKFSGHAILKIFFVLMGLLISFAQGQNRKTIAVLNFDNNSIADRDQMESLRKGLADMLSTEMSQIQAFKVVEREKLQDLLSEISLGQSGAIDPASAQKVGRLVGAQTLLLGSFINMFGGKMRIDVRIVEVETGLTLKAVEESDKVDKLFDMVKKIAKKIAKFYKIKITKNDRKRMEQRKGSDTFEATMLYSKGLDFSDLARSKLKTGDKQAAKTYFQKAQESFREALEKSKNYQDAREKLQEVQVALQNL
ncbi:MAG TPA: hypothetical protein ENK14_11645 [Caldithrix sp.]|nr:hypothetical protein [Caldithrix sp.]